MKVTLQFDSLEAAAAALGKVVVNQMEEATSTKQEPLSVVSAPPASITESDTKNQSKKKKRKRRTKAEIEADKAAEAAPEPEVPEPPVVDDLDDFLDDAPAVTTVSPEDVRKALINFKNALAAKLVEKGTDAKEAGTKAMGKAKELLNKVAGTDILGAVPKDKYAEVVQFADEQLARLAEK